jgi:hypothetical protein
MGAPVKFLENNGECLILNTYIFHEYILSGITEILLKVVLNTINPFKRCKMIFGQLKTVWVSISSYISIIYIYIYVWVFLIVHRERRGDDIRVLSLYFPLRKRLASI